MAEEKKTPERFKVPSSLSDKIVHAMDHIQAFEYHGRKVVLREQTEAQLLKMAKSKDCAVLQMKEKSSAKSSSSSSSSSSSGSDSKKAETSAKK